MSVDVRFVLAPFLPRQQPALGVSSLTSVLQKAGRSADVVYYNLRYLKELPLAFYDLIAISPAQNLLGEVLFAKALWGEAAPCWADYIAAMARQREAERAVTISTTKLFATPEYEEAYYRNLEAYGAELFHAAPKLISTWATELIDAGPRILGFSTTFQQNVASLALAQEVRRRVPKEQISILFGGANCEGKMGELLARKFDCIDHVVSGEGELTICELVDSILDPPRKSSLRMLTAASPRFVSGKSVSNLDALPVPDFTDYFQTRKDLQAAWPAWLAAETSRGCWWGAKSHCKFCGLNGTTMAYRSKTPERATSELRQLRDTYGLRGFMMADNILDTHYFNGMLPALQGEGLNLFYEVKSNLKKDQLRMMRAAGVTWIQPGVESLSSNVLQLMGKGCTALQNIQMLRFCSEINITPTWNLLYGFPGENPQEYRDMGSWMGDLSHIYPPARVLPVRLDRFSPYFTRSAQEGVANVRPYWAYEFAYPMLSPEERHDLAYFFEFDYQDGRQKESYIQEVLAAVDRWGTDYRAGARLTLLDTGDGCFVQDTRRPGDPEISHLTVLERALIELLDSSQGLDGLGQKTAAAGFAEPEVAAALHRFRERRWVFEENARIVRLITIAEPLLSQERNNF